MSGNKKGAVAFSLTKNGALFIHNLLLGENVSDIGPEVVDTIGEFTNMISGQARKELETHGLNLNTGIPTVILGKNIEINFITKAPIVSLPFHFYSNNNNKETIYIEFSFE